MTKNLFGVLLTLSLLVAVNAGCDAFGGDEGGVAQLKGQVVNALTGEPVPAATVEIVTVDRSDPSTIVATTNTSGVYSADVTLDSISTVVVYASKTDFREEQFSVLSVPDRQVDVPIFRLQPTTSGKNDGSGGLPDNSGGSGNAASITLTEASAENISVLESGFPETAQFTFTVLDSNGVPVDAAHAADISLSILAGPGGGEFVSPATATTDGSGQAVFNLTSGTRAGAVQLLAEVTVDGRTIRSKPAQIAIHGGLPDQPHFAAGPTNFNFAAWGILGKELSVTAYAGDKYGNPVRPGTVVYFTTTGGIIEGSAATGPNGAAGVKLISNTPFPVHPSYGNGYATVTASTADENGASVTDDFLVLFSGAANLDVAPYDSLYFGGLYRFFVYDQHENPLSAGTAINVSIEGENVKVIGDTEVTLDDALFGGPKVTEFQFTIAKSETVDEEGNPLPARIDGVKVSVGGPNGNTARTLLKNGTIFRVDG